MLPPPPQWVKVNSPFRQLPCVFSVRVVSYIISSKGNKYQLLILLVLIWQSLMIIFKMFKHTRIAVSCTAFLKFSLDLVPDGVFCSVFLISLNTVVWWYCYNLSVFWWEKTFCTNMDLPVACALINVFQKRWKDVNARKFQTHVNVLLKYSST